MCWSRSERSSSVRSASSSGISSRRADLAVCRRAKKPATTSPTSTAVTRSKTIVATAVMARTAASPRVERSSAARLETFTICTAVAMRTPASAARGISATHRAATRTMTSSTSAWVRAASREVAPERTLTAVRAIAGMPPKSGAARLARPWPASSRLESWRWLTLIASATVAESRLSSAASAATAIAGRTRASRSPSGTPGSDGVGRVDGMWPIGAAPQPRAEFATEARATAIREPGSSGWRRASTRIRAVTPAVTASGAHWGSETQACSALPA